MIARCPACGARNPGTETCRRCGCELHLLARLLKTARDAERRAVDALSRGKIAQACTHAELAKELDYHGLGPVLDGFLAWRRS